MTTQRTGWGWVWLVLLAGLMACGSPPAPAISDVPDTGVPEAGPTGQEAAAILQRAREVHGVHVLDRAEVSFRFRGDAYTTRRDGGRFAYARTRLGEGGEIRDVLDNDGFRRTVAGTPAALGPAEARAAEGTVNSVVYFALLPYSLADAAVRPHLLGADTLRGEPYDLVEVTFRPEGGGRDYQDRFVYWVHAEDATVDYLAYSYEVNGGGARFREAYNPRTVGGVRFADYRNFSAEPAEPPLEAMGALFEAGSLELLSEIVLDSVRVEPVH